MVEVMVLVGLEHWERWKRWYLYQTTLRNKLRSVKQTTDQTTNSRFYINADSRLTPGVAETINNQQSNANLELSRNVFAQL